MTKRSPYAFLAILLTTAIGFSLWQWIDGRAQDDVNCSQPYYVNELLPNNARWELCWEHRSRDGIVLRDVYYTAPAGTRSKVLAEASISQVHVPYDDNSARFHDITDDGFGDRNIADLTVAECPGGTLLPHQEKNVICLQTSPVGYARRTAEGQQQHYALTLFSVSTSGEYNYIPVWRFGEDGSIEPIMGATGKLQRFDTGSAHSWPVRDSGIAGISHIHNYYWRLDFDIGESGLDDVLEEIDVVANQSGVGRTSTVTPIEVESARGISPETMRRWQIRNGPEPTMNDGSPTYLLDPFALNHRDIGPDFEPWTHNDLFVTKQNDCERYVSHNPQFGGCGGNVTDFVNGESLNNADLVLWYGVTFHHIPRDEDEPFMHAHWDGFHIKAVDTNRQSQATPEPTISPVPTSTAGATATPQSALAPVASFTISPITGTIPLTVTLDATKSVVQVGDTVSYTWSLGDGATAAGITVTHVYTIAGSYPVTLTVTNGDDLSDAASQTVTALTKGAAACKMGDVNCDEEITIQDAIVILEQTHGRRFVYDRENPSTTAILVGPRCDVDMDGDCDTTDAITIFECSTETSNLLCPTPTSTATAEEIAQFEALLRAINSLYLPMIIVT